MNIANIIDKHEPDMVAVDSAPTGKRPSYQSMDRRYMNDHDAVHLYTRATVEKMLGDVQSMVVVEPYLLVELAVRAGADHEPEFHCTNHKLTFSATQLEKFVRLAIAYAAPSPAKEQG